MVVSRASKQAKHLLEITNRILSRALIHVFRINRLQLTKRSFLMGFNLTLEKHTSIRAVRLPSNDALPIRRKQFRMILLNPTQIFLRMALLKVEMSSIFTKVTYGRVKLYVQGVALMFL